MVSSWLQFSSVTSHVFVGYVGECQLKSLVHLSIRVSFFFLFI